MGIRHLNKFLRNHCSDEAIQCIHMSELSGKKIAIDISIYLYKFVGENTLIENMYFMLSIFRYYGIIPVFIFDGKPPVEKKELLEKRRHDKQRAKKEYMILKRQLETETQLDKEDKQEISNTMDILKRKFIVIQKEHIDEVKQLLCAFGVTYFDAPGEADELCSFLAIKKRVWACMSEDMDLFVYGCPRVLRYFSLVKHNVVLYQTLKIIEELGIGEKDFRQICVLSGTDYNIHHDKNIDLHQSLKLFKKYYKNVKKTKTTLDFYEWLMENTNYITDYAIISKIYEIFNLKENHEHMNIFEKIRIANGIYQKEEIENILIKDGFLFPK